MTRTRRLAWLTLLAFAIVSSSGCQTPRTQIVVWVETDLAYGPLPATPGLDDSEMDQVEVVIRSEGPQGEERRRIAFTVDPSAGSATSARGPFRLPLSFGVGALDNAGNRAVWISVSACGRTGCASADRHALVEQRALLSFCPGHTIERRIRLTARCRNVECGPAETCDPDAGFCVSAEQRGPRSPCEPAMDAGADADNGSIGLVESVAAGDGYTCAVMLDHTVRCWGRVPGRAGVRSAVRNQAARIEGLENVVRLSAGREHVCALLTDRTVRCWGANNYGQLGNDSDIASATPVPVVHEPTNGQVVPLRNVVQIGAGAAFSCALLEDGTAACWGRNAQGQLGNRVRSTSLLAFPVQDPSVPAGAFHGFVALSVGAMTACGVVDDGTTRCWGQAVGVAPLDIWMARDVLSIAMGGFHSCTRREHGRVRCIGSTVFGQVGAPGTDNSAQDTGIAGATELTAGLFHTCARISDGTVRCWGRNDSGQLGDGTRSPSSPPVAVRGLDRVVQLSAGVDHTCAVRSDHTVYCWGGDFSGELGQGRELASALPVTLAGHPQSLAAAGRMACSTETASGNCWGLTASGRQPFLMSGIERPRVIERPTPVTGFWNSVDRIAASIHACALFRDGTVRCWGLNNLGQLGDGTFVSRAAPVNVQSLADVAEVVTGGYHSCAVLHDRTMRCWGGNSFGQLGDSSFLHQPTPVTVALRDVVHAAAGGKFTCAIVADGTVRCWGTNARGELGNGSIGDLGAVPLPVTGVTNATQISAFESHACARIADGSVMCWGSNTDRQISPQTPPYSVPMPVRIAGISDALEVRTGWDSTCVRHADLTVSCWGANWTGQRGDGTATGGGPPRHVVGLTEVEELSVGAHHACARRTDRTVWCWGSNVAGELGNGTREPRARPVHVAGLDASAIAVGRQLTCAVTPQGDAKCWGTNQTGALGTGTALIRGVVTVRDVSDSQAIQLGAVSSCVLTPGGGVRCWGANPYGLLGGGHRDETSSVVDLAGMPSSPAVVEIAIGEVHACVRTSAGTIWCWGRNVSGQLGDGTTFDRLTPEPVPGITNAVSLSLRGHSSCAVLADGTARCWGSNVDGQLGIGVARSGTPVTTPTLFAASAVPGGITAISTGRTHTCAVLADGRVQCAGANWNGELGRGSTVPLGQFRETPASVLDSSGGADLTGVAQVVVGERHTCARLSSGGVLCWGANDSGQLGSRGALTPLPRPVHGLTAATSIATGDENTCALSSKSGLAQALCWGAAVGPVFSNGQRASVDMPFAQPDYAGVAEIAMGGAHTCGRWATGTVRCFGANHAGQLGAGVADSAIRPVDTARVSTVRELGVGMSHRCAHMIDGTVRCRGANYYGQLAVQDGDDRLIPADVAGVGGVTTLAVGRDHTCASVDGSGPRGAAGTVLCWGRNDLGQLGNSAQLFGEVVPVAALDHVVQVAAGALHTCAMTRGDDPGERGRVACWGGNDRGQLGDGTTGPSALPIEVRDVLDVVQVAAGGAHTCARTGSGGVWCWGANRRGQLGNRTVVDSNVPQRVTGLEDALVIATGRDDHCERDTDEGNRCESTGEDHSCAIRTDRTVWCWGRNDRGQLGDGTFDDRNVPVRVNGITNARAISLGGAHTCVLTASSEFLCWGDNRYGQLVRDDDAVRNDPVAVPLGQ